MSEVKAHDRDGKPIVEGCRVHVPPRVPGKPRELPPEDYDGPLNPRVSGRVCGIDDAGYVTVRCLKTAAFRTVPADLCRVQRGQTVNEKRLGQVVARGGRIR